MCPQFARLLPHQICILNTPFNAIDPLVKVSIKLREVLRDSSPAHIKLVITVVVALRVGRMTSERLTDDSLDDDAGNQGSIRIRTDNTFVDDLLCHNDDVPGGECC